MSTDEQPIPPKQKKLTFKIALFGAIGLGALGYALLRRPRYLYDGSVQACEGSPPVYGIDQRCEQLALMRGNGSGKIFAPFDGYVHDVQTVGYTEVMEIRATNSPVAFFFDLGSGTPAMRTGQFKAGAVIGQAERVKVSAARIEGSQMSPMSPSAWLIANAFVPASYPSSQWCEDSHHLIVPQCAGITFRAPELPKWSLRTVRMTM